MSQGRKPPSNLNKKVLIQDDKQIQRELVQNLSDFIQTTAELVEDLKQALEPPPVSSEEYGGQLECCCPRICELEDIMEDSKENPPTETQSAPVVTIEKPEQENKPEEQRKPEEENKPEEQRKPEEESKPEEKPAEADTPEAKPEEVTTDNKTEVAEKAVLTCPEICEKNKKELSKGCPKKQLQRLQALEKSKKERGLLMMKLRENIGIAQKNLCDILEQIRQLDRLMEDYDTINTPDGQVNPAALYKEIMKPQIVPHINKPKTTPTVQNNGTPRNLPAREKVSVLSAAPAPPCLSEYYK